MQRSRRLSWCAAVIGVTLFGCGGDGRPALPSPTEPQDSIASDGPRPGAITLVTGNAQRAFLGSMLEDPLVVQVTDVNGMAMPGYPVEWTSTRAGAAVCVFNEYDCHHGSRYVFTDAYGRSTVRAMPTELHAGWVTAVVKGNPPLHVTFTMDAIGVLVRAQPRYGCIDDSDPLRFSGYAAANHTLVDVGTLVEFEFANWLPLGCLARIVTTSAPIGDPGFDTGNLRPGQRFRFVPTVAGTWEFRDQYTGGVGWLTAGPLPSPPGFPPLSEAATVYNETVQAYGNGPDGHSATRFVFFDDNTFQLQFSSQRTGWFAYLGRHTPTASGFTLHFSDTGFSGAWEATASFSGDTLTVNYSQRMQMDDFINGLYIRAR